MKLGKIKFFNHEKGFGFITSFNIDYFVHKSVLKGVNLIQGADILFDYKESNKKKDTFEVTKAVILNEDNASEQVNFLGESDRIKLCKIYESVLNKVVNDLLVKEKEIIEKMAKEKISNFNIDAFISLISAKIYTHKWYKPGDEEKFRAYLKSDYPKTDDAYLKSLDPNYERLTFEEIGFHPWPDMKRDYETLFRKRDEDSLAELEAEFRVNFKRKYDETTHIKALISAITDSQRKEIIKSLITT